MDIVIVTLAALFAGLIDAVVGGGGLIQIPALFSVYPNAAPATLLGTSKCAGVWGTSIATVQYSRRVRLPWAALWPAAVTALVGSFIGAWTVTHVAPDFLRRLMPFILLGVFLYTLAKKDLGHVHAPHPSPATERLLACVIGLTIGVYDGFFGPGTGSFFIFLFVRVLGYDFLHASASAKLLNVATNVSALVLFTAKGYVWWRVGLIMAVANVVGSVIGSRLALKHGAMFVRRIFILVVGALILKTSYDAFLR